jgi:hypothetical protein
VRTEQPGDLVGHLASRIGCGIVGLVTTGGVIVGLVTTGGVIVGGVIVCGTSAGRRPTADGHL